MKENVFEDKDIYRYRAPKKRSAFYISDKDMSIDEINEDSARLFNRLNLFLAIHGIFLYTSILELLLLSYRFWYSQRLYGQLTISDLGPAIFGPGLFILIFCSFRIDEFAVCSRDITNVANRINHFYNEKDQKFDFTDAPLFFIENLASIYKPPKVAETEKMLVRKNTLWILVVVPLFCAIIPQITTYIQSDAQNVIGRINEVLASQPNVLFFVIFLGVAFILIVRMIFLPTNYIKRLLKYKYITYAYPFVIKELERRYSCK